MLPKFKAIACPFCGSPVVIKPYLNGSGASVECSSEECASWGSVFDLDEWNSQRVFKKKTLTKYFFEVVPVYKGSLFHKVQEFQCKGCKASAEQPCQVKHKKNCEVGHMLNAAS